MTVETKKRQRILRKIYNVPEEKLGALEDFLSGIELKAKKERKNIAFAGAWQNLDDTVLSDLTEDLIKNRSKNSRRNNE